MTNELGLGSAVNLFIIKTVLLIAAQDSPGKTVIKVTKRTFFHDSLESHFSSVVFWNHILSRLNLFHLQLDSF